MDHLRDNLVKLWKRKLKIQQILIKLKTEYTKKYIRYLL